jgi:hypothetical protein
LLDLRSARFHLASSLSARRCGPGRSIGLCSTEIEKPSTKWTVKRRAPVGGRLPNNRYLTTAAGMHGLDCLLSGSVRQPADEARRAASHFQKLDYLRGGRGGRLVSGSGPVGRSADGDAARFDRRGVQQPESARSGPVNPRWPSRPVVTAQRPPPRRGRAGARPDPVHRARKGGWMPATAPPEPTSPEPTQGDSRPAGDHATATLLGQYPGQSR